MKPKEFQLELRRTLDNLGTRCGSTDGPVDPQDACPMCDECDADYSAATKALFQVIYIHRPLEGVREVCSSCERYGQYEPYPCPTLSAVAHDIGVEWTPELELRAEDLVVETYSGGMSPLGTMRVIHVPTAHIAVRKEIGPDASYLEVKAELIEELKRKVNDG